MNEPGLEATILWPETDTVTDSAQHSEPPCLNASSLSCSAVNPQNYATSMKKPTATDPADEVHLGDDEFLDIFRRLTADELPSPRPGEDHVFRLEEGKPLHHKEAY